MNILTDFFSSAIYWFYGLTGDWGLAIICIAAALRFLLLPITLRQKKDMNKTRELAAKSNIIREKYKNNKKKLDQELAKLYHSGGMNSLGFFLLIMQLPIVWAVYQVINGIPYEAASVVLPWIASLSLPDPIWIVPILAVLAQVLPQLLSLFKGFNGLSPGKPSVAQMALIAGISLVFITRLPAAIALYWFSSAIVSTAQELIVFYVEKG